VNPQFVTIVTPSDLVITIPFGVELEEFTGIINLCIPYSNIESIKTKLYSGYQSDQLEADQSWIKRFLDRLKAAEVDVKVELGRNQITVQDLLQLKVGDTLVLKKEVSEPLIAQVQGVPKFRVRAGTSGGNKAIQVEERITNS
jgi:flagellar motor switch protein FliM